jgi:MOSC domain-containing protein YiiM
VQRGDAIEVIDRPAHDITISVVFRALTREPLLLERVLEVGALPAAEVADAKEKLEQARKTAGSRPSAED